MCQCLLSLPHCFTPCELPLHSALDEEKMPKEVISLLTAAGISRTKAVRQDGGVVHNVLRGRVEHARSSRRSLPSSSQPPTNGSPRRLRQAGL